MFHLSHPHLISHIHFALSDYNLFVTIYFLNEPYVSVPGEDALLATSRYVQRFVDYCAANRIAAEPDKTQLLLCDDECNCVMNEG